MKPSIFRSRKKKHTNHACDDSSISGSEISSRIVSWDDGSTTSGGSISSQVSHAKSLRSMASSVFKSVKESTQSASRTPSHPRFLLEGDLEVAEEDQAAFYVCYCAKCKISPRCVSYKPRLLKGEPVKLL